MPFELLDSERRALLATAPAADTDRKLALAAIAVSVIAFLVVAPFARTPLPKFVAFIPAYQSALVVNDVITAALLYRQFEALRSRRLLRVAAAYLFSAVMAVTHALTFPGLFAGNGLFGGGAQTTVWLYMFWHAGFPAMIIAYAVAEPDAKPRVSGGAAIAWSVLGVLAAAVALGFAATRGHDWMPALMAGDRYSEAMTLVVSGVWLSSVLALLTLWHRRRRTVLDVWLMVVMCAWIFDIALAALLNSGRFDVGFYAGRIYGLISSTFVLLVLIWRAE